MVSKGKKNTNTFHVLVLRQNLGGYFPLRLISEVGQNSLLEDKVSARKQIPDELHMHVHIFLMHIYQPFMQYLYYITKSLHACFS